MAAVLLVDDDSDMTELLADFLRAEGHVVWVARDGAEGFSILKGNNRPDLILLDVDMPVLTGPEMAHAVVVHDMGLEHIPVVLVSGSLDLRAVSAAVGTPYYLAKPYDLEQLAGLIQRVLAEREPPRPAQAVRAS
jgi:CheY-like chemotaxis protein